MALSIIKHKNTSLYKHVLRAEKMAFSETLDADDTLMKCSIHFSLIWHVQKKDSDILCKTARVHTQIGKLFEHYGVCWRTDDRIIARFVAP
jgi:hypothetical protein